MIIPEKYFIYISVFIGLIYVVLISIGYKKGFIYELVNLLYTVASLALAWFAAPVLASLFAIVDIQKINAQYGVLNQMFKLNDIINAVIYFIIIFLLLKLIYVFISMFLKSLNKIPVIGKFNQILGAVFGFLNATLIVLCLSMLLSLPVIKNGKEIKEKTILKYISSASDEVLSLVIEKISEANIQPDTEGIDIDQYREDFKQWLISVSNNEQLPES